MRPAAGPAGVRCSRATRRSFLGRPLGATHPTLVDAAGGPTVTIFAIPRVFIGLLGRITLGNPADGGGGTSRPSIAPSRRAGPTPIFSPIIRARLFASPRSRGPIRRTTSWKPDSTHLDVYRVLFAVPQLFL